jgi:hypothetical protein
MPRYEDDDVTFETPQDWEDRSVVAHVGSPGADGTTPNVMVTREPMRDGETLRGYRDRQLVDLAQQLHEFDVVESKEDTIDGHPAIILRYTLEGPDGVVEQTMTMVERVMPDQKRVAVCIATSAPKSAAGAARPVFAEILRSVRFGAVPAGQPPPVMAPPPVMPPAPVAGPPEAPPYVPMPGMRRK